MWLDVFGKRVWRAADPDPQPLLDHCRAGLPMVAHNAAFDRTAWNTKARKLNPHWPVWTIEQSDCTMSRCASLGVPEALKWAGKVFDLAQLKDDGGAMREMMKPRATIVCEGCGGDGDIFGHYCPTCDGDGATWLWKDTFQLLEKNGTYCDQDVATESELDSRVTNLSPQERRVWELDQVINERGVKFDMPLVRKAQEIVDYAKMDLDRRMYEITDREIPKATQTVAIVKYINARGVPCSSVKKGEQEDLLVRAKDLGVKWVSDIIDIRRSASKTSVAKLKRIMQVVCDDGRARGLFHYHGAHTGRWAGRLIQVHNLYRNDPERDGDTIKLAFSIIQRNRPVEELHEQLAVIFGDPMETIAKCMRQFIIADEGNKLIGGDLSNIEGVINAWLAGEEWKLEAYREYQAGRGPDLYRLAYASSFGLHVDQVPRGSNLRQIGKVQELAFGYQGSIGALISMAEKENIDLEVIAAIARKNSDPATWDKAMWLYTITRANKRFDLSQEVWAGLKIVVNKWRDAHPATCQSWWDQQDAAIEAVARPGEVVACCDGKIKYATGAGFLWCQLPSGRLLPYCRPKLIQSDDSFIVDADGERYEVDDYMSMEWDYIKSLPDSKYYERIAKKVIYEGYVGETKAWGTPGLYGGKQDENNVQAIARDILVGGMFRAEAAGYGIIMHVHDELLAEVQKNFGSADEFRRLMTAGESWAPGLPLAAKTWEDVRYAK